MSFVFIASASWRSWPRSTLAIDVGHFMTARSQAQNAADAAHWPGDRAGVQQLRRSNHGRPRAERDHTAGQQRIARRRPPRLRREFPAGPTGNNRVKVNVFRTGARANAIPTLIGPLFGVPTVNIDATATAKPRRQRDSCVKPLHHS